MLHIVIHREFFFCIQHHCGLVTNLVVRRCASVLWALARTHLHNQGPVEEQDVCCCEGCSLLCYVSGKKCKSDTFTDKTYFLISIDAINLMEQKFLKGYNIHHKYKDCFIYIQLTMAFK